MQPFLGHLLPEPFYCHSLGVSKTISKLAIALESGIYQFLPISTNYIFLFAVFGCLLQALGGTDFFMECARLISRKLRGGPAMMAVVSSAMVGTVTGSGAANVLITGTFTIPLMKKHGYTPEQAGAIEAAAVSGGQIMPPIMGMVAFGMAGLTGIPYTYICIMAVIPALIYFFNCGMYVYLLSGKLQIGKAVSGPAISKKKLFLSSLWFLVPFTVIVALLAAGRTVMFVAFWANVSLILLAVLTKKSLTALFKGLVEGAIAGAGIASSVAAVGMIATTFTTSGLGVKMASGIEVWSGGSLFFALLIIWAVCIILGMVGLSLTAYIIVSLFAVPPLVKVGVPFEIAHFFVMYVAVFAFLTPPVAVVALIAARVAQANYIRTAMEAVKTAFAAYILPFAFPYCRLLLLRPVDLKAEILEVLSLVVGLFSLQVAFVGHFIRKCDLLQRAFALTASSLFCMLLFFDKYMLLIPAFALLGINLWLNLRVSNTT
ncbi:MAG: TRAP transporter fused permease subunit [Desulfobacterota bacterium]|nr:TRAP transporter fused permease subunit [Thermodesulfobacteriota bacterium]